MRLFLFGAGQNSVYAVNRIGLDRVEGFIDNKITQNRLFKKNIFPLSEINTDDGEITIVITPDTVVGVEIAKQLREKNFYNYFFLEELEGKSNTEIIETLSSKHWRPTDRIEADLELYQERITEYYKTQRNYLIEHIDAINLKPAKGSLREYQLRLVEFSADFFDEISLINIYPILTSGNLLGYVRHRGFIPWDDDIDFNLLRKDYEVFKEFCKNEYPSYKYTGVSINYNIRAQKEWKNEILRKNAGKKVFLEYPEHIQIAQGKDYNNCIDIDFFSMDRYRDDTDWVAHKIRVMSFRDKIRRLPTGRDQFDHIDETMRLDHMDWGEGNRVFYGFDNFNVHSPYFKNYGGYIEYADIFPLKKANFEGCEFLIPQNEDAYLKFMFGKDYMDIPRNFEIGKHKSNINEVRCK